MKKHGAMLILLAATISVAGCDSDDGAGASEEGTTTMQMEGSTGDEMQEGESTGRPTPIPPATTGSTSTTDDGMTDDGMTDGMTGTGEPVELSCESYCGLYMDACQDFSEYANLQHCMEHCTQWPEGLVDDTLGDSLGCRTYHVTVASSTDPELHCPHSGPSGMHVCVEEDAPSCDLYCTRYFNNCTGDLNLWESEEQCTSECSMWYAGTVDDTAGHTTGCRAYYANLAAADDELHCPNAGPGGGEACVLGQ